jgi:hypothetical protein
MKKGEKKIWTTIHDNQQDKSQDYGHEKEKEKKKTKQYRESGEGHNDTI